jgi:hypothetical protein
MTVSFTQTYGGEGRLELLKIYFLDRKMHEFKNKFDLNIYSFHNCPESTIRIFKKYNTVKNTEIRILNDMTYTETIQDLKNYLKKIGAKLFFFSQDDTFSANNDYINFEELYDYVKDRDKNFMLNLCKNPDEIDYTLTPDEILETFKVYHIDTKRHGDSTGWPMSDEPYLCSTDLLDVIYDPLYLKQKDIWSAEWYLQRKFGKAIIPRWITDNTLFRNYNLYGYNIDKKDFDREELKKKKLIIAG